MSTTITLHDFDHSPGEGVRTLTATMTDADHEAFEAITSQAALARHEQPRNAWHHLGTGLIAAGFLLGAADTDKVRAVLSSDAPLYSDADDNAGPSHYLRWFMGSQGVSPNIPTNAAMTERPALTAAITVGATVLAMGDGLHGLYEQSALMPNAYPEKASLEWDRIYPRRIDRHKQSRASQILGTNDGVFNIEVKAAGDVRAGTLLSGETRQTTLNLRAGTTNKALGFVLETTLAATESRPDPDTTHLELTARSQHTPQFAPETDRGRGLLTLLNEASLILRVPQEGLPLL